VRRHVRWGALTGVVHPLKLPTTWMSVPSLGQTTLTRRSDDCCMRSSASCASFASKASAVSLRGGEKKKEGLNKCCAFFFFFLFSFLSPCLFHRHTEK